MKTVCDTEVSECDFDIQEAALIALGSNQPIGELMPMEAISSAICRISEKSARVCRVSRFFSTPAVPKGAGPDFINACIAVRWTEAPQDILKQLHEIEADFGRIRKRRWGPRGLDLDLLAIGTQVLPNRDTETTWRTLGLSEQQERAPDELILPHPRLAERAFVLTPLADIAPHWRHPTLHRSVKEMLDALPAEDRAAIRPV